jgi:uncharacterized protein YifN (PemK superfamily)
MCSFPLEFQPPEMVKTRAVIVVSPRLPGRDGLVAVVPISNSEPKPCCDHHCRIPTRYLPRFMQASGGDRWAKCDMLYTFSLDRLSPVRIKGRGLDGKRGYEYPMLDLQVLRAVRRAAAAGLGIDAKLWDVETDLNPQATAGPGRTDTA